MDLTATQRDRAVGVLLGTAAGDALGAGYEFGRPLAADHPVGMIGGGLGPFAPGEWTDDTSMAIAIAEIAATGADLRVEKSLDYVVERWERWSRTAPDVGVQTRSVLSTAAARGICAQTAREASEARHLQTGRAAGNGSLMRTAPVALAYLDDESGLVDAARTVSELTHFDPDAGDACVLWCTAIRHAVLTGEIDVRIGLGHIDSDRRRLWEARLAEAENSHPSAFTGNNGWVVAALQGAWSAISTTPVPEDDPGAGNFRADHLRLALEAAVRGGGDTDTVAAIAGALLGAVHGASAVPSQWRLMLHGWPGLRTRGLAQLADRIVNNGEPDRFDHTYAVGRGTPMPVPHPHDDKVWIGAAHSLHSLDATVDAVVSLCRVADGHVPAEATHLDVRLIDQVGENANLDFVLLDTVRAIELLRAEGRTVFVHCAAAQSRTPTVAALYGARRQGLSIDQALREVCAVLPLAEPNPDFRAALRRLHAAEEAR
ncbi:ADP-ribosylglycohydrolase family protein [Mycolicibacterium confluentis]|uniref:Ribosylglycohydrolase n=1 Tax=Mycolicibacterium confluentis TaxID=28047 RepID=A0A7I7XUP3_9MYCO|nr:ADP-ribosylglycohydrolase family protein [Mycolicibacterium confluentis]MCV7322326.1 ADP-ribosylglycohydrolase family protein [Mycolicibacterium confluentis]ORV28355.1 ribosylglycohydrolase [Mycolicibacterium confluentis]BBZ32989.1 ribosylglycohydrolase [Mycolicibacterium confluentis]